MKFYDDDYEVDVSRFAEIGTAVRPYTMVPWPSIDIMLRAVRWVTRQQVVGDLVECGAWRGGCSAAMRLAQLDDELASARALHVFDSFEGLPPAQTVDGPMAAAWQADVDNPGYYDNCTASLDEVRAAFSELGVPAEGVHFHAGWFDDTVPAYAAKAGPIAVLRLDGDWYSSTKVCLEHLYPLVADGGIVLIDDYYAWDGCARAVHEYLGANGLNHRIRSVAGFWSAYFVKSPGRDE